MELACSFSFPIGDNASISIDSDGSIGISYSADIDEHTTVSASISAIPFVSISAAYTITTTDDYDNSVSTGLELTYRRRPRKKPHTPPKYDVAVALDYEFAYESVSAYGQIFESTPAKNSNIEIIHFIADATIVKSFSPNSAFASPRMTMPYTASTGMYGSGMYGSGMYGSGMYGSGMYGSGMYGFGMNSSAMTGFGMSSSTAAGLGMNGSISTIFGTDSSGPAVAGIRDLLVYDDIAA